MSEINYCITVEFNRYVPNAFNNLNPVSGMVKKWALTTSKEDATISGVKYSAGYISNDGVGNISRSIDIESGGTYAYADTNFSFSIRNGGSEVDSFSIFSNDVINAYQINTKGAKVSVYAKIGLTLTKLWDGYVDSLAVTDPKVTFSCKTANKTKHENMLYDTFTKDKFPNLSSDLEGKSIPECIGEVPRAKLIPVKNQRIVIRGVFYKFDSTDPYYTLRAPVAIDATPLKAMTEDASTLIVYRGPVEDPENEFTYQLPSWYDKTGLYVDILMGGGKGQSRKIVKNGVISWNDPVKTTYYANGFFTTNEKIPYQYEYFVLDRPFDVEELIPIENNANIYNYDFSGTVGSRTIDYADHLKLTEQGQNVTNWDRWMLQPDQAGVKDQILFSPFYNKQYEVPWFGIVGSYDAENFESVDRIQEYSQDRGLVPQITMGSVIPRPPHTIAPETTYVCISEHPAETIVSTSTVLSISDDVVYHDPDFGEMTIQHAVSEVNTLKKDGSYPGITFDKPDSDKSEAELTLKKYFGVPKVYAGEILCDKAHNTLLTKGAPIPDAGTQELTPVRIMEIYGANNFMTDLNIESKVKIIIEVGLDGLDDLRKFDNVALGSRIRIMPGNDQPDPLLPSQRVANYSSIKGVSSYIRAIDVNGNVIRPKESAFSPSVVIPNLEQNRNSNIITKDFVDDGPTGRAVLEGLPAEFFIGTPDITQDQSALTGDVTEFFSGVDFSSCIHRLQVVVSLHLDAHDNEWGEFGKPHSWQIYLDGIGFTASKKMESDKISAECVGMMTRKESLYDPSKAPHRLIRKIFRQVDGIPETEYNNSEFSTGLDNVYTVDYPVGYQVGTQEASYVTCDSICKESMLAVYNDKNGVLRAKFWLTPEGTPVVTHDNSKILEDSVGIEPAAYSSVYTEYHWKYGFDHVTEDFRFETHIAYTDSDVFPSKEDYGAPESLNATLGLTYAYAEVKIDFVTMYTNVAPGELAVQKLRSSGITEGANMYLLDPLTGSYALCVVNLVADLPEYAGSGAKIVASTVHSYRSPLANNIISYTTEDPWSGNVLVSISPLEPAWVKYCNLRSADGELDYAASKLAWEKVRDIRRETGVVNSKYTELKWIHNHSALKTFVNNTLEWDGYPKTRPSYSLPLTQNNIDEVELLKWVRFSDNIHTNYTKKYVDETGMPTGAEETIEYRDGWITSYSINPSSSTINVELILSKESAIPFVTIDENTNPATEDVYDENSGTSATTVRE